MTWYPAAADVLRLHNELVTLFETEEDPIFPPGPRDIALVESACGRPQTALGTTEKYRTIEQKGAALFHSLVKNHPFHNGNKRTALVSLLTFLWRNGRRIKPDVTDDEVFDMVLAIAKDEFPNPTGHHPADQVVEELGKWLRVRLRALGAKAAGMKTRDFLNKCEQAGLQYKESGPSYVIWKDQGHSVRISRSTTRLEGPVVREYLGQLGLTDVTVAEFQEGLTPEQAEVRRFRNVLRRLSHA